MVLHIFVLPGARGACRNRPAPGRVRLPTHNDWAACTMAHVGVRRGGWDGRGLLRRDPRQTGRRLARCGRSAFEDAWDREAAGAAFGADEDVDLLKRQAAMLTRKYLDNDVAPEIEPDARMLGTRRYRRRRRAGLRGFAGYQRACDRPADGRAEASGRQLRSTPSRWLRRQLCPGDSRKAREDTRQRLLPTAHISIFHLTF
jgi:hypothetical protein